MVIMVGDRDHVEDDRVAGQVLRLAGQGDVTGHVEAHVHVARVRAGDRADLREVVLSDVDLARRDGRAAEHERAEADIVEVRSRGAVDAVVAPDPAAAGVRAVVFVPAGAPPAKLVQMLSYGAELLPVDGSYDDAFELSLAACEHFGWFNRNTAYNPFTIEGKKTAALEIAESMAYLRNDYREPRLDEVVMALCAEMLLITGIENDPQQALARCDTAVTSGQAAERFDAMCVALGGPAGFVANCDEHLAKAPFTKAVYASGYLAGVDVRAVGNAIIELGGGRRKVGEVLDLSVGFSHVARIGTLLDHETPLAVVHAASEDDAKTAERLLLDACSVREEAPEERPVICERVS